MFTPECLVRQTCSSPSIADITEDDGNKEKVKKKKKTA
jgi:hypothetical protein